MRDGKATSASPEREDAGDSKEICDELFPSSPSNSKVGLSVLSRWESHTTLHLTDETGKAAQVGAEEGGDFPVTSRVSSLRIGAASTSLAWQGA